MMEVSTESVMVPMGTSRIFVWNDPHAFQPPSRLESLTDAQGSVACP